MGTVARRMGTVARRMGTAARRVGTCAPRHCQVYAKLSVRSVVAPRAQHRIDHKGVCALRARSNRQESYGENLTARIDHEGVCALCARSNRQESNGENRNGRIKRQISNQTARIESNGKNRIKRQESNWTVIIERQTRQAAWQATLQQWVLTAQQGHNAMQQRQLRCSPHEATRG